MRILLVIACLGLLVGCEDTPYPASQNTSETNPFSLEPTPTGYSIMAEENVQFNEGRLGKVQIFGNVPNGGTPVFRFENLPDGMVFNESARTLEWTPGFKTADLPANPLITQRYYTFRVYLSTVEKPGVSVTRDVTVSVLDTLRDFELTTDSMEEINEGETFVKVFTIKSVDFPQGPFAIEPKSLPSGMKVETDDQDPTRFKVVYTPDHQTVKLNENPSGSSWRGFHKTFKFSFKVLLPNRYDQNIEAKVKVKDIRLDPDFSVPSMLVLGQDGSFTVTSFDPNGEISPILTMTSSPNVGVITEEVNDKVMGPGTTMTVNWKDIPRDYRGKQAPFKFQACVYSTTSSKETCNEKEIAISVTDRLYPQPVLDRDANWVAGQRVYLKFGSQTQFQSVYRDADSNAVLASEAVKILPESVSDQVKWENGKITVDAKKAGVVSFYLIGMSDFGIEKYEHFEFEVFPQDWGHSLFAGILPKDPNFKFYKDNLNMGIDIFNPYIQSFDERLMMFKDSIVLSSEIIKDQEKLEFLFSKRDLFKTVVISSPLIEDLPSEWKDELAQLGVLFRGRFLQQPNRPELKDLSFIVDPQTGLPTPNKAVKLKGDFSPEAKSPAVFGTSTIFKKCEAIMALAQAGNEFPVVVTCDRGNSKKYVITGFEWGDVVATDQDPTIVKSWINQLIR